MNRIGISVRTSPGSTIIKVAILTQPPVTLQQFLDLGCEVGGWEVVG